MTPKGTFSIKCNACGQKHDFTSDDADFQIQSEDHRDGGKEYQHVWDNTFDCDCEVEINFVYDVWEYPEGDLSGTPTVESKEATVIKYYSGYDFGRHEEDPND